MNTKTRRKPQKNVSTRSTHGGSRTKPASKPNTTLVFSAGRELDVGHENRPAPYRINGESDEDREKRLAKRKALTLKIFQDAYEDNRRRTTSPGHCRSWF